MSRIVLVPPAKEHEQQVMEYRREMLDSGSGFDGCAGLEETEVYRDWLDFEGRLMKKYGNNYVPSDVYLAVRISDQRVIGIMDYRKVLCDFLLNFGGNIGYSVCPSERGKGYAKEMLSELCSLCKSQGAERLLVCCDRGNKASRHTILSNGGVLENEVSDTVGLGRSGVIQRYWITL